jgi:hypothetical protein
MTVITRQVEVQNPALSNLEPQGRVCTSQD